MNAKDKSQKFLTFGELMTPFTRVVHCKQEPFDIYIGRPSKWGNPFHIGPDGTRVEVLAKYAMWIEQQSELTEALLELDGKVLGCWCAPWYPCHGDILVRLLARKKEM